MPDTCTCKPGWRGDNCSECIPYWKCEYGTCDQPWECNCETGYSGNECNETESEGKPSIFKPILIRTFLKEVPTACSSVDVWRNPALG